MVFVRVYRRTVLETGHWQNGIIFFSCSFNEMSQTSIIIKSLFGALFSLFYPFSKILVL